MNSLLLSFLPSLGMALLHVLWQALLIATVTALALRALRGAKAQTRYLVCCSALLACAALPVTYVLTHSDANNRHPSSLSILSIATLTGANDVNAMASRSPFDTQSKVGQMLVTLEQQMKRVVVDTPQLLWCWALGVAVMALRMALGLFWVRNLVAHAQLKTYPEWQKKLNQFAQQMGMQREIRMGISDDISAPVTAGWWRPMVIVPTSLFSAMPVDLLEALLAHEIAHIKRYDYVVNLLQSAIEIFLFYHPAVWWLSKQIRIEREQIADDLAAGLLGEPRRLALALSELDQIQFNFVQAANGGNLMSRITRLVRPDVPTKTLPWKMLVSMIGLSTACVVLYAQANVMEQNSAVKAPATPDAPPAPKSPPAPPAPAPAPAPAQVSIPAPPVPVSMPTPSAPPAPPLEPRPPKASKKESGDFALIKILNANSTNITSNGKFDQAEIALLKGKSKDETLWFRDNGTLYAIRDQATLNRVRQAYQPMEELGKEMKVRGNKMDIYGKLMNQISKEMRNVSLDIQPVEQEKLKDFEERMKPLFVKMAAQITEAEANLKSARNDEERAQFQKEISKLGKMSKFMNEEIQLRRDDLIGKQVVEERPSIQELSNRMNIIAKPMDQLGKEMNQLGEQMNQLSKQADNEVRELIQAAKQKGLVTPLEKM
jgi:beta-lactamase regulating signal transducer with metallopeptidase domain